MWVMGETTERKKNEVETAGTARKQIRSERREALSSCVMAA
jgi:hypothetical protein